MGLTLGVVATSSKPDERRLPLHPLHLDRIDDVLRSHLILERGYGEAFARSDAQLAPLVGGFGSREEILGGSDIVLLPKPQVVDLEQMGSGKVLWGWPHCVQDRALTQVAIDKRLTLIAFEAMNHWASDQGFGLHVFHKNNEMAGYCSVLHGLQLSGSTGDYGRRLSAVVIGFGATARGAVTALNAHGIHDVSVVTQRGVAAVSAPIHSVRIVQFDHVEDQVQPSNVITERGLVPVAQFLAHADIVVNCTLQDPLAPLMFLTTEDLPSLRPGTLIIDVSCDEGMGFPWARPTSFTDPMFDVGDHVHYYGVDHTPSYLWNSATWEISEALLPFVETVMAGAEAWDENRTIARAIEIREGRIVNPAILDFQGRAPQFPHPVVRERPGTAQAGQA
ncbi:N(5)-(carboxyethyl)ornithine synthase [Lapillicoccus sp.]|uniref:N(5)-(carboxyethyl)ornithine synthase n=1 Tax=Lapillicoccus sp. TaxID=1909287 RepID=UPI003982E797